MRIFIAFVSLVLAACTENPEPEVAQVTFHVTVPEDTPTVYLTGSSQALGSWDPAGVPLEGDGERRFAVLSFEPGENVEYQFTLGDWWQVAADEGGFAMGNGYLTAEDGMAVEHDIPAFKPDVGTYLDDPAAGGVRGTLITWRDVESEFLEPVRHVQVWLPPGYEDPGNAERRYPVIYMSDGQNLFDPRIANTGTDWGMDEAMVAGVEAGLHEAAIIVSSWSTRLRAFEYSPWVGAEDYARFLTEEIKPRVDAEFRTLTGAESTFAMGSSMGGLLSMYLVTQHADIFSACGCVSTHLPLTERENDMIAGNYPSDAPETPAIEAMLEDGSFQVPETARLFFDYGTETLDAGYEAPHRLLESYLEEAGLVRGEDYLFRKYEGAAHNEAAWRARVGDQLVWLLAGEVPAE